MFKVLTFNDYAKFEFAQKHSSLLTVSLDRFAAIINFNIYIKIRAELRESYIGYI